MRNNTTDELLRDSISNLKKFINSENGKIKLTVMILLALATGLAFHYEPTLLSVFLFLKKYLPDSYSQKQIRYAFFEFKLQKSVWVYPYPCEKEISMVTDFFGVRKYAELILTDHLFSEIKLKKHFGLS